MVDSTRPVVAHKDVYGHLDLCQDETQSQHQQPECQRVGGALGLYLLQFEDLNVSDVVDASKRLWVVWRELVVT